MKTQFPKEVKAVLWSYDTNKMSLSDNKIILDNKRQALLPHFKDIYGEGFYLAGGTALALHIGHRNSRDYEINICSSTHS